MALILGPRFSEKNTKSTKNTYADLPDEETNEKPGQQPECDELVDSLEGSHCPDGRSEELESEGNAQRLIIKAVSEKEIAITGVAPLKYECGA